MTFPVPRWRKTFVAWAAIGLLAGLGRVAAADEKPTKSPEYFRAGFDVLGSFPFRPPEPEVDAKPGTPPPSAAHLIPPAIKALDGRKVVVTGFVLPLKMEKGLVTELLLMKDQQACCYGVVPQLNEFVHVKMIGGGVKPPQDVPVEFFGKLIVKEIIEDGFLANIYTLECEKMGKSAID